MSEQVTTQQVKADDVVNIYDEQKSLQLCNQINITLDDIKKLNQQKAQYAELEKAMKPLTEKIKLAMISNKVKEANFGGIKLNIAYQDRSSMDEDKLVELLESKGLLEAVLTVKKPDISQIAILVGEGKLTDKDLKSCMVPNLIAMLKFPKAKKSNKDTEASFADKVIKTESKTKKKF